MIDGTAGTQTHVQTASVGVSCHLVREQKVLHPVSPSTTICSSQTVGSQATDRTYQPSLSDENDSEAQRLVNYLFKRCHWKFHWRHHPEPGHASEAGVRLPGTQLEGAWCGTASALGFVGHLCRVVFGFYKLWHGWWLLYWQWGGRWGWWCRWNFQFQGFVTLIVMLFGLQRSAASRQFVYMQTTYSVGQIKRGQLTLLLVTIERIYKIKWFLAGINYIKHQVTTWCQFYLNESVKR